MVYNYFIYLAGCLLASLLFSTKWCSMGRGYVWLQPQLPARYLVHNRCSGNICWMSGWIVCFLDEGPMKMFPAIRMFIVSCMGGEGSPALSKSQCLAKKVTSHTCHTSQTLIFSCPMAKPTQTSRKDSPPPRMTLTLLCSYFWDNLSIPYLPEMLPSQRWECFWKGSSDLTRNRQAVTARGPVCPILTPFQGGQVLQGCR